MKKQPDLERETIRAATDWLTILTSYQQTSNKRAFFEISVTLICFFGLILGMLVAVYWGHWISLGLVLPASGFLLRLFMLQHDCGHQSLFTKHWLNLWVGRALGVLTLTPFDYWLHNHAIHHVSSGNLDRRGVGDLELLTVDEYAALPRYRRLLYRMYRNPVTLFVIGPAYMFFIQHRIPVRMMKRGWLPWISTMGTNLALVLICIVGIGLTDMGTFLIVIIPTVLLGASIGVWMFFVQHQFEETIWDRAENWDRHEAALYGSSHYDLPALLRWFTGNIGVHHVHHLNSKIPFFRLSEVLSDHPSLAGINRITFLESLSLVRLVLWDQQERKLVSFAELANLSEASTKNELGQTG